MTEGWTTLRVADCLLPVQVAGKTKVQARDYQLSGRFPVVDQGQAGIAGWTNEESAVIDDPLPLIVFGDHTRTFKLLSIPFARGADGTQLLRPRPELDPLFFFYACRAIDLPARGYNRHFTILKEHEVSFPTDREEQTTIGYVLHKTELALMQQVGLVDRLQQLKLATMRQLFTLGLRGEAQKETEAGLAPENWAVEPIRAHHSVVSGGTPSRNNPAYWQGGTIPWVKTTEVDYRVIRQTGEHITQAGLDNSAAKILAAETLLLAMYGQGVTRGKVAILGVAATCNQACAAIRPVDKCVDSRYLYHFLTSRYDAIRQLAHGGQQQNLNLDIVRDLPIAFPVDMDEQHEIVSILEAIDRKIDLHKDKRIVLEDLFQTLLHKLIKGETPVASLDAAVLSVEEPRHDEMTV